MKRTIFVYLFLGGLFSLTGCGSQAEPLPTAAPAAAPAVNVQATVDAAVAATATAEAQLQEAIDTAVNEAVPAAVDEAVAAALEATAAAAPPPEEAAAMTEEELAALIEQTVNEAVVATETYAATTEQATADTAVTAEEVQTIELYVYGAEEAIALAEEMIDIYYDLYGDLTYMVVDDLDALVAELDTLNQNLEAMIIVLDEMNATLEAGLALAEETIAQLETAAATAATTAATAQAQAQVWQQQVQTEVADRAASLQAIQPQTVAATQQEALNQAAAYLTTVQNAFSDEALSYAEFEAIAQSSADAVAGLQAQGGPQMQNLATMIAAATQQFAGGQMQGAFGSLNELSGLLSAIPEMPSLPAGGFSPPSLPSMPGGGRGRP